MTEHPITPPPELMEEWAGDMRNAQYLATQAARWGSDQELEACCEWVQGYAKCGDFLRVARRPKPLSLKELAIVVLDDLRSIDATHYNILRNALEQLND